MLKLIIKTEIDGVMIMPSIQKKIGPFEIEVGILGEALFGMLKFNIYK